MRTNTGAAVGIAAMGVYVPETVENSQDIALKTGIPVEVVAEKLGLRKKHVARPDEHASDMAFAASKMALLGFDPAALDAVVYFGSSHKDYSVWSAASKLQYELGAHQAFATEIMSLCAGFTVALRMVKGMMLADAHMDNVLLAVGTKESSLLDYDNPRLRFMFNFGDGGAAVLLRKGWHENVVLESHHITAGFFHKHVKVLEGGSVNPLSGHAFPPQAGLLEVIDPEEMKEHLDPISFKNFVRVVECALEKSGKSTRDLNFLAPVHFKRSMHQQILAALGLNEQNSYYLEDYGHVQAADQIIALWEASRRGMLKNGDIVALMAAGTGYTWGATILQWGDAR
ncbi:MAG: 3-oxoacyl-(acyl-carrier-protein) synthase 3 [Firmicutes bacterium]|nr:3-oxoacyl-(acyl-carrier-protein) synthase 3 [candidate division NPL-UPA2 bacterium]